MARPRIRQPGSPICQNERLKMQRTKTTIPPLLRDGRAWYWMSTKVQPQGFPIDLGKLRVAWCDQSGLWMANELMSGTCILTIRTATPEEVDGRPQVVAAVITAATPVRLVAYVEDEE